MKKVYLFTSALFLLLNTDLTAQSESRHEFSLGLSWSTMHFRSKQNFTFRTDWGASGRSGSSVYPAAGLGVNGAYTFKMYNRWEFTMRAHYSGNTVKDRVINQQGFSSSLGNYHIIYDAPRTYRSGWAEGVLFWRMFDSRIKPDVQFGLGYTYLYFKQDYLSEYIYNSSIGVFDVKYFTTERRSSFGIPIQFQVKYPISPVFDLGANAYLNYYFNGDAISGVWVFLAYQL